MPLLKNKHGLSHRKASAEDMAPDPDNAMSVLHLELSQARNTIQTLQNDNQALQTENAKLKSKLRASQVATAHVREGFADYTDSLKRKHRAEAKGMESDIDNLTKIARGFHTLLPPDNDGDADTDPILDSGRDIFTRSRKRARTQAAQTPLIDASPSGSNDNGSVSGTPAMPQRDDFPAQTTRASANER